uniref:One cut domain family member n=1 Tax=Romanomermis culicivorax TaxID=13658 RepID=A0A915HMD8_ROMCU
MNETKGTTNVDSLGSTLKEPTLINVSSTQRATESPTKPVPGIRHLFSALPSVSLGGGIAPQNPLNRTASQIVGHNGVANNATLVTGIPSNYLAVKIEHSSQQNSDILFTNNGGSSHANLSLIGGNTTLLSPAQLTLGSTATCGSSNLSALSSSPGDFLSLAPSTTVYVQPVNQNGHLQFIKLNFTTSPSSVICSEPTFASSTSLSNLHKLPSSVNTVQLASNLIASMLQEQEEQHSKDLRLKGSDNSLDHIVTNCENAYLSVANEVSINENRAPDQVLPLDSILNDQVSLTAEKMLNYDRPNDRSSGDFNLLDQRQQCVASTSRKSFRTQTSMYNNTMSVDKQNNLISSSCKPKVSSSDHHDFTALKTKQKEISIAMANLAAAGEDDTDDIFIDTKDLCNRIAYELKAHSIPQAVFAERVLCRSQGTLSDLLRNPKPWNKLKSGRETFRRMYYWLKLPVDQRLAILEIIDDEDTSAAASITDVTATSASASSATKAGPISVERLLSSSSASVACGGVPTSVVASSTTDHFKYSDKRRKSASSCLKTTSGDDDDTETDEEENRSRAAGHRRRKTTDETGRGGKRPRLVFTDIQKRTLQTEKKNTILVAIFKETQRPSREMQQTIAEHLGLDLSTVQNFFMNARRRTRFDQTNSDSSLSAPYPYQQVRTITPPPVSRSPTPGDRDVLDQPDDGDDPSASNNMPRPVQLFRQAVAAVASPEAAAALMGSSATSQRKNQRIQQKSRGSKRIDNATASSSRSSKARSLAPSLPRGLSVKAAPVSSDQWKIIQLKFDPGAPGQGIGVRIASSNADRSPPSTSNNPEQAVDVGAPPSLTDETLNTTTTTNDDQNSAPITCDLSQLSALCVRSYLSLILKQ